jgi:hypothetical protein
MGNMAVIKNALRGQGLLNEDPMMNSAQGQINSWMNYDPNANPVTGTGSITGSGMGAILDALARNSYQNVEGAVNKQANVGREAAIDELSRRGIVTSSEAPASMSVLEGQRLDQIRNAAQNIEGQRLQGQMQIPGMLQGIGNFGASAQQRLIGNTMNRFSMVNQMDQIDMQRRAQQQQAAAQQQAAYGQLGSSLGSMVGMAAGSFAGPAGMMAGSSIGSSLGSMLGGGNNPNADVAGYSDPRMANDYSSYL